MIALTLLAVAVLSLVYLFVDYRRRAGGPRDPPGPIGLPIVGYFPFLGEFPQDTFTELGKKYGKIYRLPVGRNNVVVLNDYDVIKEAFVKQGHHFEARANALYDINFLFDNVGIYLGSLDSVRELRRLTLSTLKDFGFGFAKPESDAMINAECDIAISKIEALKGDPFDPMPLFGNIVGNIITRFLWSKNYDYDDPAFLNLVILAHQVDDVIGKMDAIDFMPWLRICGTQKVRQLKLFLQTTMDSIIDECVRTFDEKNIRNFVDVYLRHMKSQKIDKSTDPEKYSFMIRQLRSFLIETFTATVGAVAITLSLIVKVFVLNPDVQDKACEEVDRIVGADRSPSYGDRHNMPYTEALTFEALRFANITPLGIYKSNAEKVTIMGYDIAPNSIVYGNFGRQQFDPEFFKNPDEFDVAHCLDQDGKAFRPEHSMPFGTGRRICPGQNFTEMKLFLIIACLLQKFRFKPSPVAKAESGQGVRTVIIYQKAFDICAVRRT